MLRGLTLDELEIRLEGDETLGRHADGRPSIAGIQIVSGAGRENVIDTVAGKIGGDFDRDAVLGDNGIGRLYNGTIYELVSTDLANGEAGFQTDTISAGDEADLLIGGNGNDTISGQSGDDLILGDNARLILFDGDVIGLPINEKHHGDHDRDDDHHHWKKFDPYQVQGIQLLGDEVGGNDVLEGGRDSDLIYGQFGNDTYVFSGTGLGYDSLVEAGSNCCGNDHHHHHDHGDDEDHHGHGHEHSTRPNDLHDRLDFTDFAGPVDVDLGR